MTKRAVRPDPLRDRPHRVGAALGDDRSRNQDRGRRPGVLSAAARRSRGPRLHRAEVPVDDRERRIAHRPDPGRPRRSAHHAGRPSAPRHGDGRVAAAVEHLRRRHELCRSPTAGPRRSRSARRRSAGAALGNSGLRPAARRPTGIDRPHAGLRRARYSAHEQVPPRSPVPEARELLAGYEADRVVVLDHRTRCMGITRSEM